MSAHSRLKLAAIGAASAAAILSVASARAQTLPEGPGKEAVQTDCTACHELSRVTNAGHTVEGWQTVLNQMVNVGAPLPRDQIGEVAAYLAKNFPEKPAPPAVVIAGPVQVTFKEWSVPTPGSRPHDPLAAPDGTIWYTGHTANVLGHLDPRTGKITEYHPKTPGSGPHGLTFDRDGNIWFTGNFKGYIGKFDPKTSSFTEYPLPDPAARDPHTPLFDQSGTLWFTVQSGNMVGRLNPQTGDIKLVTSPTPKSNPYGMVISSKGVPFFDEFGSNKIASIDPSTMQIHEYVLPHPQSRPRRIAITPDDVIYYSDYSRGFLGRLDPKSGQVSEWPSPGGPKSLPYAMTYLNGAIWYAETGVKPNTLVRFDLATQKFQTWEIPSGGGVIRNMMPTRDGNIAMAESGIDKIALAQIAKPAD